MIRFLESVFGEDWRTSIRGWATGLCSFLLFFPAALEPLPDYWENLAKQGLAFLVAAGFISMGTGARDKKAAKESRAVLDEKIDTVESEAMVRDQFLLKTDKMVAKEVIELKKDS